MTRYCIVIAKTYSARADYSGGFAKTLAATNTQAISCIDIGASQRVIHAQNSVGSLTNASAALIAARCYALDYDGSNVRLYADGALKASLSCTTDPSTSTGGAGRMVVGAAWDVCYTGHTYMCAVYTKSQYGRLDRITADPWGIFAPQLRYIPLSAAAAASTYTLSAATYTNLSATGVTPRVTVTVA
jgi:hypothetical protein